VKKNSYFIQSNITIKQAIKKINEARSKIVFVLDNNASLIGSVSDGDIRRAILNNVSLADPVSEIMNPNTKTLNAGDNLDIAKDIMIKYKIEAIPLIDSNKKVLDVLFWNELFSKNKFMKYPQLNLPVIIMAGGKGTRMEPITSILPKPLIPLGDKPMIEVIMDEFAKYGMKKFYISINYKGKMIKAYFDDHDSDYSFKYIQENKPLGTGGALKYLSGKMSSPFFVSNCDIIVKDDYSKMYDFHKAGNYCLTMISSVQHYVIPYGICEIENGGDLIKITEKPEYDLLVNTGMYILNPEVLDHIPEDTFFHITHLIEKLKSMGKKIGVYPVSNGAYFDFGQISEYNESISKLTANQKIS